jgi:hypothetical protein
MKINRLFVLASGLTLALATFLAAPLFAANAAAPEQTDSATSVVAVTDAHIENLSLKYGLGPEPHVKGVLEVVYKYANTGKSDKDENGTRYQWYISDSKEGKYTALKGIHAKTIILLDTYVGKYLKCEITAQDAHGNQAKPILSAPTVTGVLPTIGNPLTDWFYKAKYGLSHHLLKEFIARDFTPVPERWDASKQTWAQFIDQFDVKEYAKQVNESGAKFVLLTLNQNSGYYLTPIAAYDRAMRKAGLIGDGPNPMTSTRDLPLEIMDELAKYGIKVMLYHPSNPPNGAHWKGTDYKVTSEVFHYTPGKNGAPGAVARQLVNEIISELAIRYGEKLAGFWFDGFYKEPASVYNNMGNAYNIADFATAAKKGNPYRIVAYNVGWDGPFVKSTVYSDYSSGENPWLKKLPPRGRFVGNDCQRMNWGVLGRMDNPVHGWGCPGVSKKTDFVVERVNASNSLGSVVILDTRVNIFGVLDPLQCAQLRAVKEAVKAAAGSPSISAADLGIPTRLTTDLLERTDSVFLDGYASALALDEIGTNPESRYQLTEIHNPKPYLGWVLNSKTPNTVQEAYRILVASSKQLLEKDHGDLWDSGKVKSDNSIAVSYAGKPLKPGTIYYWKVRTWDNHLNESPFSEIKSFLTAKKLDGETARYPVEVEDEYPVKITSRGEGGHFIDFGKAAFGRLKLTLSSEKGNEVVTIHLGENAKDGAVDRKPGGTIRYAKYSLTLLPGTHIYSIKIRPDKRNTSVGANGFGARPIFMPNYTGEVYPFRYCEIENYRPALDPAQVVRPTVFYPFDPTASDFQSSDTVLNQVWELCKYSVKATSFAGICVDGDRERIPYEGDFIVGQPSRYSVDREFAFARHTHEYLINNATWATEWILQSVLMAWTDYLYTGNPASLQRYYEDLKAKTLLGLKKENGLISTRIGKQTPAFLKSIHYKGKEIRDIVDWPQSGILGLGKKERGETDGFVFTEYNTVVNAYHYEALRLFSEMAGVLGKNTEQEKYAAEAQRVKTQINRLLLNQETGYYKDGVTAKHHSAHANFFPLAFGIVPEENRAAVLEFLRSREMACSVYGAQFLVDAFYNAHDAASGLKLLASTEERSWYNMIRAGSTVSMEAWDNKYKPNQDWNHIWGAAPANLIPRKLMGIEPLEPGFRKIRIKPQPATLRQAAIKVPSIRGDIKVSFDNLPGESFHLEVEIPVNSTAEVWLPKLANAYKLSADGGVTANSVVEGDFIKILTGSGKHVFTVEKVSP